MIRTFKMKKLSRQPHQQETLTRYFKKTIWHVVSITGKVEQKALPFDGALIQKDLKDHEGEQ